VSALPTAIGRRFLTPQHSRPTLAPGHVAVQGWNPDIERTAVNREIVIAAICVLATLAIAWLVDHPDKLTGTAILLVAFGIVVAVARNRTPVRSRSAAALTRKKRRTRR
jgi:hypothetical protein